LSARKVKTIFRFSKAEGAKEKLQHFVILGLNSSFWVPIKINFIFLAKVRWPLTKFRAVLKASAQIQNLFLFGLVLSFCRFCSHGNVIKRLCRHLKISTNSPDFLAPACKFSKLHITNESSKFIFYKMIQFFNQSASDSNKKLASKKYSGANKISEQTPTLFFEILKGVLWKMF